MRATPQMTNKMAETLELIQTGMLEGKPHASSFEALESRGYITVRDIDGEIRVTTSGFAWLMENRRK